VYKKEILISIMVCALIMAFTQLTPAATDDEGSTITLEVGAETMIDLTPASFSWTGGEAVSPGQFGAIKQAQIENIGSRNLTEIWFNVSQPTGNPYGSGNNGSYVASNFVWIAKETGNYFAVDRKEYNETRSLIYLTDDDSNSPPNSTKYAYGRFRNATGDYFWMFDKSSGDCDGANFYVGDVAHTQTATGSVDFSTCDAGLNNAPGTNCRIGALTAASVSNYCYADVNIGGDNYTIAVDNTTLDNVRWSHWNQDLPGADAATNDETFYTGTLYPGNSTVANITVVVTYGVAQGILGSGTLYVIASDGL